MGGQQTKITTAVNRLNAILPLTAHQYCLDEKLRRAHQTILHAYVEKGRSLNRAELAQQVDDIDEAVNILQANDLVIFDDNGEPVGAYPFTMEKRGHVVTVNGHHVHCMCALDALAVSPMFHRPTGITSRCHVSSEAIRIQQDGLTIANEAEVKDVLFGINWSASSSDTCCADSLCTEMIFLKDKAVADGWLDESSEQRKTFTLYEAIDFAAQFFVPLTPISTRQ